MYKRQIKRGAQRRNAGGIDLSRADVQTVLLSHKPDLRLFHGGGDGAAAAAGEAGPLHWYDELNGCAPGDGASRGSSFCVCWMYLGPS